MFPRKQPFPPPRRLDVDDRPAVAHPGRLPEPAGPRPAALVDVSELRDLLRIVVREELAELKAERSGPAFVDKHSSGLGPSVFLAAARRGEFDTFRVGKRFVAREADAVAYIERQLVEYPTARR